MKAYFGTTGVKDLTMPEIADYYRQRKIGCVIFSVDSEARTGFKRYPNEEVARLANENSDIMIPFGSIDPAKGMLGAKEARRLVRDFGVKGFKFHPSTQAFFPNDRMAYPLYEAIAEEGAIALFHSGQTGAGSGMPGGGGVRLKYANPMFLDDVAVDFPTMPIILAHPSFPWQEEALSVAQHKPNVYIDLSGWSPKVFSADPGALRQLAAEEEDAVRLGLPGAHARPLDGRFRKDRHQAGSAAADPEGQRGEAARLQEVENRTGRERRCGAAPARF